MARSKVHICHGTRMLEAPGTKNMYDQDATGFVCFALASARRQVKSFDADTPLSMPLRTK